MDQEQRLDQNLEARNLRRLKAEDRFLTQLERREAAAERHVGEICRDGQTIHYVNCRSAGGVLTGRTREFLGPTGFGQAIRFLIGNNYV